MSSQTSHKSKRIKRAKTVRAAALAATQQQQLRDYFDRIKYVYIDVTNPRVIAALWHVWVERPHPNPATAVFPMLPAGTIEAGMYCNYVGLWYEFHKVAAENIVWYERGVKLKCTAAMSNLAQNYGRLGDPTSTEMALTLWRTAIDKYHCKLSMYRYGLYLVKRSDETALTDAKKYFEMAADLGCVSSMIELSAIYKNADNRELRKKYAAMAAENGSALGAHRLAEYYNTSNTTAEPDRIALCVKWYEIAAAKDQPNSCFVLANYHFQSNRFDVALKYYLQGIGLGNQETITDFRKICHKTYYKFMPELRLRLQRVRDAEWLLDPPQKLRQFMATHRVLAANAAEFCLVCLRTPDNVGPDNVLYHYSCIAHQYCLECLQKMARNQYLKCSLCELDIHPYYRDIWYECGADTGGRSSSAVTTTRVVQYVQSAVQHVFTDVDGPSDAMAPPPHQVVA